MQQFLVDLGTRKRTPFYCWSFALAAFLASLVLRFALAEQLPAGFPFLTFFPAVIVTAFLCGLWPGTAVAVASGLAAWWFFIPPSNSFKLDGPAALALLFYAFIVAVDIVVIHVMNVSLGRLRTERERSQNLADSREIMFQELQHRISNNLLVVSALMNLQKASLKDEDARRVIEEAAARLALIGKIHRQLHDPSGQSVEFGAFLKELCHDVIEASGASASIVCLVRADAIVLPAERTVPVALIVTELVSNALEHAFAVRAKGTITIDLTRDDDLVSLTIEDDGAGLAAGFDLSSTRSLGLRIVKALTQQLGGAFAMATTEAGRATGTACRLRFPISPLSSTVARG
jgi:two-component system, sensor histidine kinase PdtaS